MARPGHPEDLLPTVPNNIILWSISLDGGGTWSTPSASNTITIYKNQANVKIDFFNAGSWATLGLDEVGIYTLADTKVPDGTFTQGPSPSVTNLPTGFSFDATTLDFYNDYVRINGNADNNAATCTFDVKAWYDNGGNSFTRSRQITIEITDPAPPTLSQSPASPLSQNLSFYNDAAPIDLTVTVSSPNISQTEVEWAVISAPGVYAITDKNTVSNTFKAKFHPNSAGPFTTEQGNVPGVYNVRATVTDSVTGFSSYVDWAITFNADPDATTFAVLSGPTPASPVDANDATPVEITVRAFENTDSCPFTDVPLSAFVLGNSPDATPGNWTISNPTTPLLCSGQPDLSKYYYQFTHVGAAAGDYILRIRAAGDSSRYVDIPYTLSAATTISISPGPTGSCQVGGTVALVATVSPPNTATWTLQSGPGSITPVGNNCTYSAGAGTAGQQAVIRATYAGAYYETTITLSNTSVNLTPASQSVSPSQTVTVTHTASNGQPSNLVLTGTAPLATFVATGNQTYNGVVNGEVVSIAIPAGALNNQVYVITATNTVDAAASKTCNLTVNAQPTITIAPTSSNVGVGGWKTFSYTINNGEAPNATYLTAYANGNVFSSLDGTVAFNVINSTSGEVTVSPLGSMAFKLRLINGSVNVFSNEADIFLITYDIKPPAMTQKPYPYDSAAAGGPFTYQFMTYYNGVYGGLPPGATSVTWSIADPTYPAGSVVATYNNNSTFFMQLADSNPLVPGTYSFILNATTDNGVIAQRSYTFTVYATTSNLEISYPPGATATLCSEVDNVAITPVDFDAINGVGTLTWSIDGSSPNPLPTGLSLHSGTGVLSGTPTAGALVDYEVWVKVTDSTNTSDVKPVKFNIAAAPAALTVGAGALPSGQATVQYTATVSATGGSTPYAGWSVSPALPTGLTTTFNADGTLSINGTLASTYGPTPHTFTVTDCKGATANAAKNLTFGVAGAVATVSSVSPVSGSSAGVSITLNLSAPALAGLLAGDVSVRAYYAPPDGTTFSRACTVTSRPSDSQIIVTATWPSILLANPAKFLITKNSDSSTLVDGGATFQFTCSDATPSLGSITPSSGTVNSGNITVTATGTFPANSTVSFDSQALPVISNTGTTLTFSVPNTSGQTAGTKQVKIKNACGVESNAQTFTFNAAALDITTAQSGFNAAPATKGTTYTASSPLITLAGSGGVSANYRWTMTGAPSGLSIDNLTGKITGTVDTSAVTSNSVVITLSLDPAIPGLNPVSKTFTIQVIGGSLTIETASLNDAYQGSTYAQDIVPSGGNGTITFALIAGSLPAGVSLSTVANVGKLTTPTTVTAAPGNYSFTVSATDTSVPVAQVATKAYTLVVRAQKSAPVITGISPDNGPFAGGNVVTITGTDFRDGVSVTFNSSLGVFPATDIQRLNSTTIVCKAPTVAEQSSDLLATVNVINSDTGTASVSYTYKLIVTPNPSAIDKPDGPFTGGQEITVTGTNFDTTSTLKIDGVACTIPTGATSVYVNSTTLKGVTPAYTGTASRQSKLDVFVTVTNSSGQTGQLPIALGYTYRPAPVVTAVLPPNGSTSGGTTVFILGGNFFTNRNGVKPRVYIGGVEVDPSNITLVEG